MSEIGNVTAEIFVTFMLFYLLAYLKMDPNGIYIYQKNLKIKLK
jgi:hypothetical protein